MKLEERYEERYVVKEKIGMRVDVISIHFMHFENLQE